MHNNKQKFLLRLFTLLIAVVVLCSCSFATVSGLEIGNEVTITRRLAYRGGQQSGEGDVHAPGDRSTHYNSRPYWYNGWSIDVLTISGSGVDLKTQYDGKTYVYCIEHGAHYDSEMTGIVEGTGAQLTYSAYWFSLGEDKQRLLQRLMPHCFPAKTPAELGVSSVDDVYSASQIIVWEVVEGYRDANGNLINSTLRDQYLKYTYTGYGHTAGEDTPAMTAYNKISNALVTHSTLPSGMARLPNDAPTVELTWSETAKRYEYTLTDSNSVLDQFTIPSTVGNVHLERSGNTLTMWSETALTSSVSLELSKALKRAADTGALAIFGGANSADAQKMMYGQLDDPVSAYLNITTDSGTLEIIKKTTVPNGTVAGIVFSVYSPSWNGGTPKEFTTDANGRITTNIPAGKYIVEEISEFAGVRKPAPQTVVVKPGSTPASVTFTNTPEDEEFTVRKVDLTWGQVANIPFRVGHTGGASASQNWYYPCTTNAGGEFKVYNYDVTDYYWRKYYKYNEMYENGDYASETAMVNAAAEEIYAECFGTSTTNKTARLDVIRAALRYVNTDLDNLLTVVADTYEVTELGWKIPAAMNPENYLVYYRTNQEWTKTVSINPASTGNVATFDNGPMPGSLLIVKTSEDGVVNGIPFLIEELDADDNVLYSYQYTTRRTTVNGVATDGVLFWSNANVVPGRYRITELECAENGYEEQAPQIVTVKPNVTTTVEFANKVTRTPVPAYKTSDSGDVAGFNFTVTGTVEPTLAAQMKAVDPSFSATVSITGLVSNANGKIVYASDGSVAKLLPGTYTWREVLTAEQAKIYKQPDPITITIQRGDSKAEVHFHNAYSPKPVNVQKESNDGVLEGWIFSIVGETATGLPVDMQDLITNAAGKLIDPATGKAPELYPGEYTLTEHLTEEQAKLYKQPDPVGFTITPEMTGYSVTFTNTYLPLMEMVKTSPDGNVDGFAFYVTTSADPGTVLVGDLYSHDGGKIERRLADGTYEQVHLEPGSYYLYEKLTEEQKQNYMTQNPAYFSVTAGDETVKVDFENLPKEVTVGIYKYTDDMNNLGGFHFVIEGTEKATGDAVYMDDLLSDSSGTIRRTDGSIPKLKIGTYTIREVLTAEQAKIYKQPDPQTFTLTEAHVSTGYSLTFNNHFQPGEISVVKQNRQGAVLAGAEYLLQISTDGGKTWSPVTAQQCSSAGLTNGRLVTGADGKVVFEGLTTDGTVLYRLTETKAPEGCSLLAAPLFEGTLPTGETGLERKVSITATDDMTVILPMTGGNGLASVPVTMAVTALLVAVFGGWLMVRRRKQSDITG